MNTNDLIAMVLLFMAVTDTICLQYFWPKMVEKTPELKPQQVKTLTKLMNGFTILCFTAAIIIYVVRPL